MLKLCFILINSPIHARDYHEENIYFQNLGVLLEPNHQKVLFYKDTRNIYLTRVWANPCQVLNKIGEDKSQWPCSTIPNHHFHSLVKEVVTGCKNMWEKQMNDLRTNPDFENFAETSKSVTSNVSENFQILPVTYSTQTKKSVSFSDIVSKGLDIVETINEDLSVVGIVKNIISSFTALRQNVCAKGHNEKRNLGKGQEIARAIMFRIENDVLKLKIGSTPSSQSFFNLYLNSCMLINSDRNFCEKYIRSDYFRVTLVGVKPVGYNLQIFLKFPVFSKSNTFAEQTVNEVANVGYFLNGSHYRVKLPSKFVISKSFQVYDIHTQCSDFCDVNSVLISKGSHCLKGLLDNESPKCFAKKMRPGFKCLITKNFVGPLIYANNATFLPNGDVHSIRITGNRLITSSGNLTCVSDNYSQNVEISTINAQKGFNKDYETRIANTKNFVHEQFSEKDLYDHVVETMFDKTKTYFTSKIGLNNQLVFGLVLILSVTISCLTGPGITERLKKRFIGLVRRLSQFYVRAQTNGSTRVNGDNSRTENPETVTVTIVQ